MWKRGQKERKNRGAAQLQVNSVFGAQQGIYTYELIVFMTTCARPGKVSARSKPNMGGGEHKVPPHPTRYW